MKPGTVATAKAAGSAWSDAKTLRQQVQKWWDRGELLATLVTGENLFPRRLVFKTPASHDLSEQFEAVRAWISTLQAIPHCRIEWREMNHRVLGANRVPCEVWVDTLEHALAWIAMQREWRRFASLLDQTRSQHPALLPWLAKKPLRALDLAQVWSQLLAVVTWQLAHPRPGVYVRQVDAPGVHSKFIESHRAVLAEWFELALPPEAIADPDAPQSQFARRYGFLEKPAMVRCRLPLAMLPLDAKSHSGPQRDCDVTMEVRHFANLVMKPRQVIITENEINYLALPWLEDSVILFGAGYGFDALKNVAWLREVTVWYWGDIDTHGFAILDQLRSVLPNARSFLMDHATLLQHQALWGQEEAPGTRDLPRLGDAESAVYDDLRDQRLGPAVRLEQERIGFEWVRAALDKLGG